MSNNTPISDTKSGSVCDTPHEADYSNVKLIDLQPEEKVVDFKAALLLANAYADDELEEHMLLSFYDGDKDFESPPHAGECHADSAIPGYVDYALYRDASLRVDIESGRFVFFYLGLG